MVIDFDKITVQTINGFKGGQGELDMAGFADDRVKIMRNVLKPQASAGTHLHGSNSEMIYVIQGELTVTCDGQKEIVRAGQLHYCPMGHQHNYKNLTAEDVVFLGIVPEHHA
ncbi:MAG: cupin domain-containing protein [Segatella oulorum]|jgi:cupin domain-containing protein|uniref:Cupin type-2 domain-containing protein n=2 Tax=Segatella oulorum TaxID=28136 RepID=G1WA06_9BACT|nr:cupin domain-containing protein [Segatella oulorum]EGV34109.1 hypothetical protein HMPREF9431_00657 [Segatella oulorum F0390]RKW49863.1 MAG: cupin domain-containing protein [Prevotella sp.]SJZ89969.1 Cupin domain-containing protein [Segatella oulorum]